MIIFFIIQQIAKCQLEFFEKELTFYPTVGEYYEYNLYQVLYQTNQHISIICNMDTQIPNVKLKNQCQAIYQTQGQEFQSMSSNNTHFVVLSQENSVFIYEWQNQTLQQVGQSVTINSSYTCFNIYLSLDFEILLDCYWDQQLLILQLIDAQFNIIYSSQSIMPITTKIQSFFNGINTFIIYASYYQNYSILSLFSAQFQNLSSINNQFIDFDIPIKINPNIYAITSQEILQYSINQEYSFELQSTFQNQNYMDFININVYYNNQIYSQCDQILISNGLNIFKFQGCENQILLQRSYHSNNITIQILQNNQFILFYSMNYTSILTQQTSNFENQVEHQAKIDNYSLLYFNADNELFSFNNQIIVYQISLPTLEFNFTNQNRTGNSPNFIVTCTNEIQDRSRQIFLFKLNYQILFENDTNIYVIFNQYFMQYNLTWGDYAIMNFFSYSGQLLNYQPNQDVQLLNFTKIDYYISFDTNQTFYLSKLLSVLYNSTSEELYLVGYNNQSLDIFFCILHVDYNQCRKLNSIQISIDAKSLEIAYSIYPTIIIIGLSENDTIYLFQQYCDNNTVSYSNHTFQQQFSDFLVTYNNIILLILNEEIQIMTLNFTNTFSLNQEQINKIFKNNTIQFNPIQIVVNTQQLSSLLYINNINEVIIISINQYNQPIPISLIQVNFNIKQINLVNDQLILSYICNNDQNICFQVWNVQNLPKYYYVKNLYSLSFENTIIIQSDNLFFYVTYDNYTAYAYNPSLPYHMSLYYKKQLKSLIQCSSAIQGMNLQYYGLNPFQYDQSIIMYQNILYQFFNIQAINISISYDNQNFIQQKTYPQVIYNFSVISELNDVAFQSTPNQSITFFSNFTVFQNQKNYTINLIQDNINFFGQTFTYPMNLILDRQISQCQSQSKECNVTKFSTNTNQRDNLENFTLITQINNEFFALQNNLFIQIMDGDFQILSNLSYAYLNFSKCLISTSNNYALYSICQNNISQYLLTFNLISFGIITQPELIQLPVIFVELLKISSILNQHYILGLLNHSTKTELYWLNQSQNSLRQISNQFQECHDFSVGQIIKFLDDSLLKTIAIFYTTGNELCYNLMEIEGDIIILRPNTFLIDFIIEDGSIFYLNNSMQENILFLQSVQNNAIVLLSFISHLSVILDLRIDSELQGFSSKIIRTIPNYGNLSTNGNSFYYPGVIIQQFQYNDQYPFGIYYLDNLDKQNGFEPVLMSGSFNTISATCAIIVNSTYLNGICLSNQNNSIQNFVYSISTFNITCHFQKNKVDIIVPITCSNIFSSGIYNITFNLPQVKKSHRGSIYALLSIIALLLLYFYIKVKQKTKNFRYISSEIEL